MRQLSSRPCLPVVLRSCGMQNASLELQDIMQRIELGMLGVPPCNNADIYFSEAIKPHRLVCPECSTPQDTETVLSPLGYRRCMARPGLFYVPVAAV